MAKYYGRIGFVETAETSPGDWEETVTERYYYGDVIQNRRLLQNSDGVNDNINISNQISIVADPYATNNLFAMRYIEFMGSMWDISNIEVQYPRLILTVGGVCNIGSFSVTSQT